ncbi:MAG: hypothetical protein ACRC7B_02915 [Metamycoplasmataceae bacterium]
MIKDISFYMIPFIILATTSFFVLRILKREIKFRNRLKSKRFEITPAGKNLEIWESEKKSYLYVNTARFFTWVISILFGSFYIILIFNRSAINQKFFYSPIFILSCIFFFANNVASVILLYKNWRIMEKIFFNNNFVEDVNLKKFLWFFKTTNRLSIFATLHRSFLSFLFATIIYKDIEKNKLIKIQEISKNNNTFI